MTPCAEAGISLTTWGRFGSIVTVQEFSPKRLARALTNNGDRKVKALVLNRKAALNTSAMYIAAIVFLGGCADTASLNRAEDLSNKGRALLSIEREDVTYEAIPSKIPSKTNIELFEKQQWPILVEKCLKPHAENEALLMREVATAAKNGEKIKALEYGVKEAKQLEVRFVSCSKELGLIASVNTVLKDGRVISFPQMLEELIPLVKEREVAILAYTHSVEESDRFWASVGTALAATIAGYGVRPSSINPSQIWIAPYYRADGTRVTSHWRTTPNSTCLDNIRGCR